MFSDVLSIDDTMRVLRLYILDDIEAILSIRFRVWSIMIFLGPLVSDVVEVLGSMTMMPKQTFQLSPLSSATTLLDIFTLYNTLAGY